MERDRGLRSFHDAKLRVKLVQQRDADLALKILNGLFGVKTWREMRKNKPGVPLSKKKKYVFGGTVKVFWIPSFLDFWKY